MSLPHFVSEDTRNANLELSLRSTGLSSEHTGITTLRNDDPGANMFRKYRTMHDLAICIAGTLDVNPTEPASNEDVVNEGKARC